MVVALVLTTLVAPPTEPVVTLRVGAFRVVVPVPASISEPLTLMTPAALVLVNCNVWPVATDEEDNPIVACASVR